MEQELNFSVGDYLLSKRFGWQYKIISIRYGVAVIQDIVRENVRMKFSLTALCTRVKNDSFAHSPLPFYCLGIVWRCASPLWWGFFMQKNQRFISQKVR